MAVKHIPTGVIHRGTKGGKTCCGADTNKNYDHWVSSSQRITCNKNGCKNLKRYKETHIGLPTTGWSNKNGTAIRINKGTGCFF